jgi:hypothetical protein
MFSFKSITLILAAAAAVVTALPATAGEGLAKREAAPAPAMVFSGSNVARAAEAMPVANLKARCSTCPTTVPQCVSTYQTTVAPIYAQIDAAITAKAAVSVFVTLWLQVLVALKALVVNLTALIGAEVSVLGGLTIDACADLFIALVLAICVKLQACVSVIAIVDFSVFLTVFVQICAQIVLAAQAFVHVCVGVNAYFDAQIVACVNILITLCATLGAAASVIASINGLLVL